MAEAMPEVAMQHVSSVRRSLRKTLFLPWKVIRDIFRLFRRNPQLAKVTLAAGLQMSAAEIAPAFDMGPDVYDAWKDEGGGAAWVAWFGLAESCVALLTAPAVGFITDKVDRRIAYAVFGLITCLPTWVYWFVDLNDRQAVWANHIALVFAATGTTSNVAFALSVDVTPFEDRELAAGAYYGMKHLITLLLAPLPCLILLVFDAGGSRTMMLRYPRGVLIYQLILTFSFVFCVSRVKRETRGSEDNEVDNSPSQTTFRDFVCLGIEMLQLMWGDYRLRRLCFSGFVLSICRTAALGNNGQFFYQALRLDLTADRYIDVNVMRNFARHLAVLPGFMVTGYLAMKQGTLKTLRRLVPITAMLLTLGVLMEAVRTIWFTMFIEFVLAMTDLYNVPLNRLVAGVARPGRIGAWLNMLGVAVEVGAMLGNLFIIGLNLSYWHVAGSSLPLWTYYPVCGLIMLLALVPLLPDKPGPANSNIGWGAAAGLPAELLHNTLGVVRIAKSWRKKTQRSNLRRLESENAQRARESEEAGEEEHGLFSSIARVLGISNRHFSMSRMGTMASARSTRDFEDEATEGGLLSGMRELFGLSRRGSRTSGWSDPTDERISEISEEVPELSAEDGISDDEGVEVPSANNSSASASRWNSEDSVAEERSDEGLAGRTASSSAGEELPQGLPPQPVAAAPVPSSRRLCTGWSSSSRAPDFV